jgi:hypothetical protein
MRFALILAFTFVAGASAEPRNPYLPRAVELLHDFKEAEALKVLTKASRWPQNSPGELAQVHLLTGLAHAALAHEASAIESFKLARMLAPELTLPPGQSPRIASWWALSGGRDVPTVAAPPDAPPQPVELSPARAEPALLDAVAVAPEAPAPTPAPTVMPEVRRTHSDWWVAGAGVAVGAGLAAAALTEGLSAQRHHQASVQADELGQAQSEYQIATASAQRANWLYAAGGALVAASVVVFAVGF